MRQHGRSLLSTIDCSIYCGFVVQLAVYLMYTTDPQHRFLSLYVLPYGGGGVIVEAIATLYIQSRIRIKRFLRAGTRGTNTRATATRRIRRERTSTLCTEHAVSVVIISASPVDGVVSITV